MLVEKKYFPEGYLDGDSADIVVAPNSYVNAENIRSGTTDNGSTGIIEAIGSNVQKSPAEPSVSLQYHGGAEDIENSRVVYILFDIYSNNHKIMCYDYAADVFYTVLKSSQVTGGLRFSKYKFVHSARVVGENFYFTDDYDEPRRVNIDAGIKLNHPTFSTDQEAYTAPVNPQVVTIIRKPPNYPLVLQKKNASSVGLTLNTNQIANNAFRFTYFFTYRNGEKSTLAMHSTVAPYGYKNETENIIELRVPTSEAIDQDVKKVTLCVIYASDNTVFEIKTWDKSSTSESAEIAAHNAGTTPLTYYFANNEVGVAISEAKAYKPYDSVPLLSTTLERANERLFLGNNLMGYDTPAITSLSASVASQNTASPTLAGSWVSIKTLFYLPDSYYPIYDEIRGFYFAYFANDIDATHPAGYYDLTSLAPLGIVSTPASINIADYTWIAADVYSTWDYIITNVLANPAILGYSPVGQFFQAEDIYAPVTAGATLITTNTSVLKSGSARRLAIVFYDKYMRQCGVVKLNTAVSIPDRGYTFSTTYYNTIQWALNNALHPADEIPDWAYFYSIVSTKDLVRSSFMQARATHIKYAVKAADGTYTYSDTYANTRTAVAVKLDVLAGLGMGYVYSEGDQIRITTNFGGTDTSATLSVTGQEGDYVLAALYDFGTTTSLNVFFEIFTPAAPSASQYYYEQGAIYPVQSPTTPSRRYSVVSGQIAGDVYLIERTYSASTYITENMSPNDNYWSKWATNAGRLQIVDTVGQQRIKTGIRWSNVLVLGTNNNGLSSFDALDQKLLPIECGALNKLQLTSKVGEEIGLVMLGICEKQTVSMYLGEVQLYGSNSASTLAQSPSVIGSVNVLKGNFGTVNPESVCEYRGNCYWFDAKNGSFIQYSANGLYPISQAKNARFWKLWSDKYLSMTQAEIEALGNRPFVFTVVDANHNELLISIPKLSNTPPKGYLPDYPSTIYPFDAMDYQAKTMVYKINPYGELESSRNHWQTSFPFCAEGFICASNKLLSWKYGRLYLHNQTSAGYNNFYGIQYTSRIMFVANAQPTKPKVYNSISIDGNIRPSLTYLRSEQPYEQASDLLDFDYRETEGMLYANIYRNKIVPTATGYDTNGLTTGEKMRTPALKVMLEFPVTNKQLQLRFVNIGYQDSIGHNIA